MCFVRARENDQVVLTTYGRSSGFCVDPIEKKPLHHFYPGTSVLSADTGKVLWSHEYLPAGHGGRPTSAMAIGNTLWIKTLKEWVGRDLDTGAAIRQLDKVRQQCYPDHATPRFILGGQMHFVDVFSGEESLFQATRSACAAGFFPANGLIYTAPTRCACYPMVRGYLGLAPASGLTDAPAPAAEARLEKGPAFGAALRNVPAPWPTYRHDPARSGTSVDPLPTNLKLLWSQRPAAGKGEPKRLKIPMDFRP